MAARDKKLNQKHLQILLDLLGEEENKICADCQTKGMKKGCNCDLTGDSSVRRVKDPVGHHGTWVSLSVFGVPAFIET